MFLFAAEQLGCEPVQCTVIEDSPHGITAARAAGMKSVGFLNPNSGDQDLTSADLLVNDFSEESREKIMELVAECNW